MTPDPNGFTDAPDGWRVEYPGGAVHPVTVEVIERHIGTPGAFSRVLDRVTARSAYPSGAPVEFVDTSVRHALAGLAEKLTTNGHRAWMLAPGEHALAEALAEVDALKRRILAERASEPWMESDFVAREGELLRFDGDTLPEIIRAGLGSMVSRIADGCDRVVVRFHLANPHADLKSRMDLVTVDNPPGGEPSSALHPKLRELADLNNENERLCAIVDGRTVPPTDAECDALANAGGSWIVTADWFAMRTPATTTDEYEGREEEVAKAAAGAKRNAHALADPKHPERWVPVDQHGRPCAWPVTT